MFTLDQKKKLLTPIWIERSLGIWKVRVMLPAFGMLSSVLLAVGCPGPGSVPIRMPATSQLWSITHGLSIFSETNGFMEFIDNVLSMD